jgi:serine/threonine-protein phosphatase PGAM5
VPDLGLLPDVYARFLDGVSADEYGKGAKPAAAAIERHAVPATAETHELIITHSFLIAWFVRHAFGAPEWRRPGLNVGNGALTVILYRPDRPLTLITFNDMSHLPPHLRWTSFPPELRVRPTEALFE